jgi:lincosamide nucleotidyltransferase A/C/D/E
MVSAEDAIKLYKCLMTNGIQVWLNGGWGIDALLGEQTRPHKDLDVFILLDDISQACELLGREGYSLKELWSENRWAVGGSGIKTITAFVLQDPQGHELDVHALYFDKENNGLPAWEENEGFVLTPQDLAGIGRIAEFRVQCITAEKQLLCHTGYVLPEQQLRDLKLLHEKFGV